MTSERIEVGINGTFFNRKQGYYVSPTIKAPQNMPTYDPTLNSRLQVFVSNYFLETMLSTYFKTDPFHYDLLASEYADVTLAPFDSNTLEGIFPYLTSRFGKKVPTDISFQITDAWGVQSFQANKSDPNNQTGLLTAHARMQATVTLRYPTGDSVTVGTARFPDVEVAAYVNQTNQTLLSTWLHTCNASEMYLDTTYMGSYRSSPYVVNQATRLLINFFNRKYLSQMFLDLKSLTMGMFLVDDPYVGYYDGFMGFGMTADFANTTVLTSASPLPDRDHLDITSKIYALLRSFI